MVLYACSMLTPLSVCLVLFMYFVVLDCWMIAFLHCDCVCSVRLFVCVVPGKIPRVCTLRSITLTYRSVGYGYGCLTQLADFPGRYVSSVVPVPAPARGYFSKGMYLYPGCCRTGIQHLHKARVRLWISFRTHRKSDRGNIRENTRVWLYTYISEHDLECFFISEFWLGLDFCISIFPIFVCLSFLFVEFM